MALKQVPTHFLDEMEEIKTHKAKPREEDMKRISFEDAAYYQIQSLLSRREGDSVWEHIYDLEKPERRLTIGQGLLLAAGVSVLFWVAIFWLLAVL